VVVVFVRRGMIVDRHHQIGGNKVPHIALRTSLYALPFLGVMVEDYKTGERTRDGKQL